MTLSKEEQLYRIANHIASAKGSLPEEWQPWADEIEADLRKLASQEPAGVSKTDLSDTFTGVRP